jgi:hypothetical protein
LIGDTAETATILGQWTELMRLKATIETGAVVPSVISRKLAAADAGNVLSRALRALGRIERTLFTLQWLSDYNATFGNSGTYLAGGIGIQTNTASSTWVWSELGTFPSATNSVSYQDAVSNLEHELSEVMGRNSYGGAVNAALSPLPEYGLLDFFSYTAATPPPASSPAAAAAFGSATGIQDVPGGPIPGVAGVAGGAPAGNNGAGTQYYFSPDGKTITLPFRSPTDDTGNDLGDWGSDAQQATQVVQGQTITGTDSFAGAGSGLGPVSATDVTVVSLADGLVPNAQCFASGTRIATTRGAIAVERLAKGDYARTAAGGTARIEWIGHRHIDCTRHKRPHEVMPVRVARDAFRRGHPGRDLCCRRTTRCSWTAC